MNTIINAAISEREWLLHDKENCEEIMQDTNLPEETRAAADIRIMTIENSLSMIDGLIALHLERMPVESFIEQINTNLSDQWN
jgi:hypothetical protein